MSVTEHERNQLYRWFEEHMGPERTATMMSLLPPVGWGDVATKRDIERLDTKIDAVAERLDTKIDAIAERLDTKIDVVAERLEGRVEHFAAANKALIYEVRSDLQRTFATWLFVSQAGVIAAVSVLLAAMR